MRINYNAAAVSAYQNLNGSTRATSASMGKLSSGHRINKAADDASGLSTSNKLRTEIRSLGVASRNVEQANSILQIAETAANSIREILVRQRELTVQAASSNHEAQRPTLMAEHDTLLLEIERIATSTSYRGTRLLNGTFTSQAFQIGPDDKPSQRLEISLAGLTVADLDMDHTPVSLVGHLGCIDIALERTSEFLSAIGAYQNRLTFARDSVTTSILSLSATQGTIRDADMAQELAAASKHQSLQQAGFYLLAQSNQAMAGILSLFR